MLNYFQIGPVVFDKIFYKLSLPVYLGKAAAMFFLPINMI